VGLPLVWGRHFPALSGGADIIWLRGEHFHARPCRRRRSHASPRDERFWELFKSSSLVGAFPGVAFRHETSDELLGEADVLLVFADGTLVPGECKLRSSGWTSDEQVKLDRLVDALDAPWSFVATPEWAQGCSELWRGLGEAASRQRVVLTGEHLLEANVAWTIDKNPFEWREESEPDHLERETRFCEGLPQLVNALMKWYRE
jgi:hypothetical protein